MKNKYLVLYSIYFLSSLFCSVYMFFIKQDVRWILGLLGVAFILVPILFERIFKMKNFALSAEIILFVFLSYQLGVVCRFYALFKYYDLFVHGLSGFFFTRLGIYLGHKMSESHSKKQNKLVALFGLMFSMTIAVLWEIYEYFGFELFELDSQLLIITGIKDTMEDMIICLIISVLTYLLSLFHYGKRKLIIFKSIDKLIETK